MTILLVFLLKTLSTGVTSINPPADIDVPTGRTPAEVEEEITLHISPTAVLIDDRTISSLTNFKVPKKDLDNDASIRSLSKQLKGKVTKENKVNMNILADGKVPFDTLNAVMKSAGKTGFTGFRLLVIKEE
jgi:biopolymer transport protein ExbD